jgi:NAD(P)-dependent dehydrogenase (short-subunit alcohol dehydrogenase family)
MTNQFDGQISIVTGAGSGIGFATAEGLAASGATVICVDWKGAEEAAASIRSSGGNATGVKLDVRDSAGWTALIADVVARKRGKICNVASTAAHIGLRDAAAYCASKGAVLALTRQAGVQYAPYNIQINSVSPGTTMTGLQRDVTEAQRAAFLPLRGF